LRRQSRSANSTTFVQPFACPVNLRDEWIACMKYVVGCFHVECCSAPEATSILASLYQPLPAVFVGTISMTRLQLFGVALATAFFATASVHAEGDKAAGRKLIYTCAGCHGVPGYTNAYPQYPVPKIAGQNEQYIVNALHGYQSGDRKHPTMGAQAQSLSDTDIQNIAAYLSSLAK
jgi:cytochrome c553